MRIGFGYDVHAFGEDRELVLGGVRILHETGLAGHSDADVVLHAISDAVLGSAALGDIGEHFPDTDPRWQGADSGELLDRVVGILRERGFRVVNVDVTVVAQKPRISPYVSSMRSRIAELLGVSTESISVKATTTERLGFVGREEGIAAYAVCLVEEILGPH